MSSKKILVTGGAGFFGSILVNQLLHQGHNVVSFDLNKISINHKNLKSIQGDIRNPDHVYLACKGVDIVHHNVAQVPIAKDKELFDSVNLGGARVLADQIKHLGVGSLVYTSSSAVFGVPSNNPVTSNTKPTPAEEYGKAKYEAENIFRLLTDDGVNVAIIRPRTILGTGRLGIFQILFEWIYQGKNIPVLGQGDNIYQFVHALDLASACIAAGEIEGNQSYNIGAKVFCSMRETLEGVIEHANSKSRVIGVNKNLAKLGMNITSSIGVSPLGPYHSLMYGESMYFDISDAEKDLDYKPIYSNIQMFKDSYDWYLKNRTDILSGALQGSGHQSKLRQGILSLIPYFLRW
jgi:nucleoside-diphosphate-sugar epimerase